MCKTKHSSKNWKQYLLNFSNLDIIWYILTTPDFIHYSFWTSYEVFLSFKYFFFFVSVVDWTFFKSTEE